MSATVPTRIPEQLSAGDSATWKLSLSDYPASAGWAVTYALRGKDGLKIAITSAASGDDHLFTLTSAVSGGWVPGQYRGFAYVAKDQARETLFEVTLCVRPNFANDENFDPRSRARRILDSLEEAILKVTTTQATAKSGGIVEWSAEGLSVKRSSPEALLAELTKQRDRWAAIVASETARDRLAAGKKTGRTILYRFAAPR